MRFAIIKDEKTTADLVTRVFDLRGRGSKERAKEIETAVLEANPHLKDIKKLPQGTLIVLPEGARVKSGEEVQPAPAFANQAVEQALHAIGTIRTVLDASIISQNESSTRTIEALDSTEVKAQARKDPAFRDRLTRISQANKARLKEVAAVKTAQDQALEQLGKDLTEMISRLAARFLAKAGAAPADD